jgi:hypothetical protein
MSDEAHMRARLPVSAGQELSALQRSVKLFRRDVLRFADGWQAGWTGPVARELAEINEVLLVTLAELEDEFSRAAGPVQPQVEGLLAALVGRPDAPGPLLRLQRLAGDDPAATTLEEQRLLSEADTLFIELNTLRAEWQDYLALVLPSGQANVHQRAEPVPPPRPRPAPARPDDEDDEDNEALIPGSVLPPPRPPPAQPPARQREGARLGIPGILNALLPVVLVLLVIAFLGYELVGHLPKPGEPAAPGSATASARPTPRATPQPTIATPVGPPQLSVTPPSLLLPCPATGAATLQLANTGVVAFDWQAIILSTSSADPGILLDGETSESGHLDPGALFQMSVTAQERNAQGTISIRYTGASGPIAVPYSVGC